MLPAARFATAALAALAREERAGHKPLRLLEAKQDTWRQFKGRMAEVDLLQLLLEDAAVTQPFAFDAQLLMGNRAGSVGRLSEANVGTWIHALPDLPLEVSTQDYLLEQAGRLDLPTRLARGELHRGIRPHHRVLELPGTGGLLSSWLVEQVEDVYLQDSFTISWNAWNDRMMAGLVAVEQRLSGEAPILEQAGIEAVVEQGVRFDYVIGTKPERGLQPDDSDALTSRFPGATILLV